MKFTRRKSAKRQQDQTGTVVVRVVLQCPKRKGYCSVVENVTRAIYLADAKVSDVADAIEAALFEEQPAR